MALEASKRAVKDAKVTKPVVKPTTERPIRLSSLPTENMESDDNSSVNASAAPRRSSVSKEASKATKAPPIRWAALSAEEIAATEAEMALEASKRAVKDAKVTKPVVKPTTERPIRLSSLPTENMESDDNNRTGSSTNIPMSLDKRFSTQRNMQ
eukprot:GSChrysophyteH1.ASY1.ANO1.1584.1 assembled CDS